MPGKSLRVMAGWESTKNQARHTMCSTNLAHRHDLLPILRLQESICPLRQLLRDFSIARLLLHAALLRMTDDELIASGTVATGALDLSRRGQLS
jgi:hypothetical protein